MPQVQNWQTFTTERWNISGLQKGKQGVAQVLFALQG